MTARSVTGDIAGVSGAGDRRSFDGRLRRGTDAFELGAPFSGALLEKAQQPPGTRHRVDEHLVEQATSSSASAKSASQSSFQCSASSSIATSRSNPLCTHRRRASIRSGVRPHVRDRPLPGRPCRPPAEDRPCSPSSLRSASRSSPTRSSATVKNAPRSGRAVARSAPRVWHDLRQGAPPGRALSLTHRRPSRRS